MGEGRTWSIFAQDSMTIAGRLTLNLGGVTAGPIRMAVNGMILLLVILFLPNGLASIFNRFRPAATMTETA